MAAKSIVRGDKEIIANLRRARAAAGGSTLDKNMRKSLEPMREQIETNAKARRQVFRTPRGGHLDQGIVAVRHKSTTALNKEYWISLRKRARKIGHLVEYGTAPHLQPNRGIMHPGARPYPFMRPGFESTKNEVVGVLAKLTWAAIRGALAPVRR